MRSIELRVLVATQRQYVSSFARSALASAPAQAAGPRQPHWVVRLARMPAPLARIMEVDSMGRQERATEWVGWQWEADSIARLRLVAAPIAGLGLVG
jgi:hypothetical protein